MADKRTILRGIHPGRYINRELKRRGYTPDSFTETVGTNPKTLTAILDGTCSVDGRLALRIEKALQLESGILMELQLHYHAKQESRRRSHGISPDLSKIRRILFWDTPIEKIDWIRQQRSIILRVFERGNAREKVVIRQFYGKDVVAEVLAQGRR